MDKNIGYKISKAVLFDNGRGVAFGENPNQPEPYVTWMFTDRDGKRAYEWGNYKKTLGEAQRDFSRRVREYINEFSVKIKQIEAPGLYKYYSTQRPVDIGTFPRPQGNEPDEIKNFDGDGRIWVEHGQILAWGYLTYTKPLSEAEQAAYELKPSLENRDVQKRMDAQAQVVGKFEDIRHIPDSKRLTWFYPDFGSYVAKEFVTPEQLAERFEQAQAVRGNKAAPIAQQMKEAQALTDQQGRPAPAPDKEHEER